MQARPSRPSPADVDPRPLARRCSKLALLVVSAALAVSSLAPTAAHAAGPKRLSAALEALRNSQKQLEDAKQPPAALHEKSLAAVRKAIEAVEKEIKAYNDLEAAAKAKAAEPPKPEPKPAESKSADPKSGKPKPAPASKEASKDKPAPKPAAPKANEEASD